MEKILPNRICIFESEPIDEYIISTILNFSSHEDSLFRRYTNEIQTVYRLIYYSIYLFKNKATPGQKLFNCIYDFSDFHNNKKYLFLLLKYIIPYIKDNIKLRIQDINEEEEDNEEDIGEKSIKIEHDNKSNINIEKRKKFISIVISYLMKSNSLFSKIALIISKIKNIIYRFTKSNKTLLIRLIEVFESFYLLLEVFNYLVFINQGVYSSIVNFILNINFIKINPYNNESLEFNNMLKQTVFSKLIDIILFIFKFKIGKDKVQSFFMNFDNLNFNSDSKKGGDVEADNSHTKKKNLICAICNSLCTNHIQLKCGDDFCYSCISKHLKHTPHCPK